MWLHFHRRNEEYRADRWEMIRGLERKCSIITDYDLSVIFFYHLLLISVDVMVFRLCRALFTAVTWRVML